MVLLAMRVDWRLSIAVKLDACQVMRSHQDFNRIAKSGLWPAFSRAPELLKMACCTK
jgi:hypothetical protein